MEAALARGEYLDVNEHCPITNAQARVLVKLGIKRVPKDVTPNRLEEFLAPRANQD